MPKVGAKTSQRHTCEEIEVVLGCSESLLQKVSSSMQVKFRGNPGTSAISVCVSESEVALTLRRLSMIRAIIIVDMLNKGLQTQARRGTENMPAGKCR